MLLRGLVAYLLELLISPCRSVHLQRYNMDVRAQKAIYVSPSLLINWFLAYKRKKLKHFVGGVCGGKEGGSLCYKERSP